MASSLVLAAIGLPWRAALRAILGQAVAAVPAAVAALALIRAGMVEGAGDALHIGFVGYARHHPFGTLALALGPALACALPALLWVLPFRLTREERARLLPAATALVVGVLLFYFASLPHRDPIWVGWRAGQIMLVALPGLVATAMALGAVAARLADRARRRRGGRAGRPADDAHRHLQRAGHREPPHGGRLPPVGRHHGGRAGRAAAGCGRRRRRRRSSRSTSPPAAPTRGR